MSCDNNPLSENGSLGLPPETLIDIFCRCLPSDRIRLSTRPQLLPPCTFAQVCSLWRRLVLSSPQLWNHIVLGRHGADSGKEISVLDNWLERAGSDNVPLRIVLDPQIDDPIQVLTNEKVCANYERETTALITKLCNISHRWQSLALHVLDADVFTPLFSILSRLSPTGAAMAPLLEDVELTTTSLGGYSNVRVLHNIARTCPLLRSAAFTCPSLFPAPVGQQDAPILRDMRILRLRFCTAVSHALDWISICPNLHHLNVQLFSRTNEGDDDPDVSEFDGLVDDAEDEEFEFDEADELAGEGWVIFNVSTHRRTGRGRNSIEFMTGGQVRVLAQLTRLELSSFSAPSSIGMLLDSLSIPALRCLKVRASVPESGPRNARWLHIVLLLHRSDTPPIEELDIIGVPMNIDDMHACLTLTRQLKRLSIGMFPELDDLLQELTIPGGLSTGTCSGQGASRESSAGSWLCPQLEVLDVADASFSVDRLASMISSRFTNQDCESPGSSNSDVNVLKELCVGTDVAKRVAEHPSIAQCISQDLKLTVVDPDPDVNLSFRVY